MIKAHKKSRKPVMRRTARVFLNDLNPGKSLILFTFLSLCHDITQYFVDLFWQRKDYSPNLADLETVHKGRDRFNTTTRLAQALAKQAKEIIRSARGKKPRLRRHVVTLYYHFVTIENFIGKHFDFAIKLIGSGAPRITIPVHSTKVINNFLQDGWNLSKSIRLGKRGNKIFIDFIFEKERPNFKNSSIVVGMDSNYKNGFVFSDGQVVGQTIYPKIKTFSKRQKHTYAEIKSLIGEAFKQVNFSNISMLCIEDLKKVKHNKKGTFPRVFNRRLSHWLYAYTTEVLSNYCEKLGVRLERKNPAYTSQYCSQCYKWDRRNRRGDKFKCVHCGFSAHADHNAAHNLSLLGLAGVYGLRSLPSSECKSSE